MRIREALGERCFQNGLSQLNDDRIFGLPGIPNTSPEEELKALLTCLHHRRFDDADRTGTFQTLLLSSEGYRFVDKK